MVLRPVVKLHRLLAMLQRALEVAGPKQVIAGGVVCLQQQRAVFRFFGKLEHSLSQLQRSIELAFDLVEVPQAEQYGKQLWGVALLRAQSPGPGVRLLDLRISEAFG